MSFIRDAKVVIKLDSSELESKLILDKIIRYIDEVNAQDKYELDYNNTILTMQVAYCFTPTKSKILNDITNFDFNIIESFGIGMPIPTHLIKDIKIYQ